MSEKNARKNVNKRSSGKRRTGTVVLVVVGLLTVLAGAVLFSAITQPGDADKEHETAAATTFPVAEFENVQDRVPSMQNGNLQIENVGAYTGIYMEDGTDELVSGVMMMVVTNTGKDTIQYAQIEMKVDDEIAQFALSTLPAGASVVLLEQNRMAYVSEFDYSTADVSVFNIAYMQEPLSMQEDKLKIQALDGVINVTNISGEDITGDIIIYYKNSAVDLFYGGITYRITISGGLKADEVKQIMASHFNQEGSTIMFVSVGE